MLLKFPPRESLHIYKQIHIYLITFWPLALWLSNETNRNLWIMLALILCAYYPHLFPRMLTRDGSLLRELQKHLAHRGPGLYTHSKRGTLGPGRCLCKLSPQVYVRLCFSHNSGRCRKFLSILMREREGTQARKHLVVFRTNFILNFKKFKYNWFTILC